MKKRKFLLVGLLAIAASLTTACNSGEESSVGSSEGSSKQKVELSMFRWDFAYINTARRMGSPLYKKVCDQVGVQINAITTGSADWDDTISRRFQTNELPDMFISKGPEAPDLYYKMIRDEALVCISDYVTDEATYPNLFNFLKNYEFLKKNIYYANNKFYSIPVDWTLEFAMYVRKDWVDNLNKPEKLSLILKDELGREPSPSELNDLKFVEPTNLVEFYRLARAFRYYDPDENGVDDTWGYTSSDCYTDNWIYNAFGGYNNMIRDTNGTDYTVSDITDGNKKAVAFINRLIQEDIMHPDWVTDDVNGKEAKFMQGKVGLMLGHTWYNTIVQGFMSANFAETIETATAKIDMIAPPANIDGTRGCKGHPNFWTSICINADIGETKIRKALELMDYLHSPEGLDLFLYGIEGTHFEYDNQGNRVSLMGQNSKGFNYTLLTYEKATVLGTYATWTADYYSPFATNAEKIIPIMDEAKKYNKPDEIPYLQTPLFMKYSGMMFDYFLTTTVNMVRELKYYDKTSYSLKATPTWENLIVVNDQLNTDWESYKNSYLTSYHGKEVIDEYNEYAHKLGYPEGGAQ